MGLGPGSGFAGFFPGVNQGLTDVQQYDERNLQNKQRAEYLQAQQRENQANNIATQNYMSKNGYQQQVPQVSTGDPVMTKLAAKFKGMFSKNQSTAGQSTPPAAQATTPPGANAAASAPGPSSSDAAAGGTPGASGAQTLDSETQPVTQSGLARANGGAIPGRGGLRMRKAKPGNVAKPTKAAAAAMHPPMEKAPQDNQEMGAEGGPPGNTEPSPSNQDPMLANGGNIQSPMTGGMSQGEYNAVQKDADGGGIKGRKGLSATMKKFSNGGKVPPVQTMEPKPNPKMVEQDVNNDGQRNRLGRTIKKFDDGGSTDPSKPAVGLEPAQPAPESTLHHLAMQGVNLVGGLARASLRGGPMASAALDAGEDLGNAAGAALASPWDPPKAKAPAAPQPDAGPPNTPAQQAAEGPPDDLNNGSDRKHATPIDVISPAEAARKKAAGETGAFMVDEDGQPTPSPVPGRGQPPSADQGPPKPAGNAPIDFSNVDIDHTQIPNTTADDWEQTKKDSMLQLIAKGVPASQAKITVDDQVSDYQHRQFIEMMQQGIALDRSGNKQGAMAALRTAYQYMPTGHDVHFGVDKTTGNIVGYGVDEKTGKPVGAPVLLDQKNLNGLLSTFADPKAFQNESLAMREQALREAQTTQGTIPLQKAQAQEALGRERYYDTIGQDRIEAAMVRSGGSKMPPQSQKFYAGQFNASILDPKDQGEALGVAESLEGRYGNSPQTQGKIAGIVKQLYSLPPDQRQQFAAQNHIQLPGVSSQPDQGAGYNYGGYGVPPR